VIANRIVDGTIRSRWFRGPAGSALAELALDPDAPIERKAQDATVEALGSGDADLLKLVVQGLSDEEIAERLDVAPGEVARRLASMYASIGASSRADATAFAFQSGIL
jgi:DNA-binding NarL/FixJ family response regulator